MADKYAIAAGGNWDDDTTWSTTSGGANDTTKPTNADNIFLDANSGNVVINATSVCRSLNHTGYTGTLSGSSGFSIGDGTPGTGNIFLLLVAGMTSTYSGTIILKAGDTTQKTLTTAGKTLGAITLEGWGSLSPNVLLADDLICGNLAQNGGIFNSGGNDVTTPKFTQAGANGRTVTITNSTITLTSTSSGGILNLTAATINAAGSTIIISSASASDRIFYCNSGTFGTFDYTVAGSTGKLSLVGSPTIDVMNFSDVTNARTLELVAGETLTMTAGSGFNVNGTAGKLMTIQSNSSGTPATIAISSGNISVDYVVVKDITVTGGTFTAGFNSVDGGGNTGVTFLKNNYRNLLGVGS